MLVGNKIKIIHTPQYGSLMRGEVGIIIKIEESNNKFSAKFNDMVYFFNIKNSRYLYKIFDRNENLKFLLNSI